MKESLSWHTLSREACRTYSLDNFYNALSVIPHARQGSCVSIWFRVELQKLTVCISIDKSCWSWTDRTTLPQHVKYTKKTSLLNLTTILGFNYCLRPEQCNHSDQRKQLEKTGKNQPRLYAASLSLHTSWTELDASMPRTAVIVARNWLRCKFWAA